MFLSVISFHLKNLKTQIKNLIGYNTFYFGSQNMIRGKEMYTSFCSVTLSFLISPPSNSSFTYMV